MVLYIICALLAKKTPKNKIVELRQMIARAVLIHGLIGWQCKSHSPLTRKTQTAGWRRRDKNVDSCGSRGISTEGMRRWQREKNNNTWLWQSHEWETNSDMRLFIFRGIHVNIRPGRTDSHPPEHWCYDFEMLREGGGNTAIRNGEHKWFIETSPKS